MPGKGKGKPCDVMGVPGALPVLGERQIPTTVCAMYGWVGCLDAGVTGLTRVGVLKLGDLASKVLVSSVDTQRWRRGESRTKPGVCDEDDRHLVTHLDRRHRLEPLFFPPPCPCSLHQHLASWSSQPFLHLHRGALSKYRKTLFLHSIHPLRTEERQ